jgi:hypothetical protein
LPNACAAAAGGVHTERGGLKAAAVVVAGADSVTATSSSRGGNIFLDHCLQQINASAQCALLEKAPERQATPLLAN